MCCSRIEIRNFSWISISNFLLTQWLDAQNQNQWALLTMIFKILEKNHFYYRIEQHQKIWMWDWTLKKKTQRSDFLILKWSRSTLRRSWMRDWTLKKKTQRSDLLILKWSRSTSRRSWMLEYWMTKQMISLSLLNIWLISMILKSKLTITWFKYWMMSTRLTLNWKLSTLSWKLRK